MYLIYLILCICYFNIYIYELDCTYIYNRYQISKYVHLYIACLHTCMCSTLEGSHLYNLFNNA